MGTVGSTKVEAEMGVGTDFLICARDQSKVDCGNSLPNWIAAAIKSRLWELIAKFDSSCYQRFPNWIAAAINPQTPPPCPKKCKPFCARLLPLERRAATSSHVVVTQLSSLLGVQRTYPSNSPSTTTETEALSH